MATVNRFSRPAQVAKFDPLSAQEIMAIPLLKQEMEDKQIEENRALLKQMHDMQAVGPDQARVNAKKDEYETRLQGIAEDITKNGISRQKTDAFNKLKLAYDKELSLSGEIGHANAFVSKRDAAKKNFYDWAIKNDWNKDDIDTYWQKHSDEQSAFGNDGTFNTEYAELGLPKFVNPNEILMEQAKILGYSKTRNADGVDVKQNTHQVANALAMVMSKFKDPNTPEGRLAQLEGWDADDFKNIKEKLRLQAEAMITVDYDHSANDAIAKANRKVTKKTQAQLQQEFARGEKVWETTPGSIRKAAGFDFDSMDDYQEETEELQASLQEAIDNKDWEEVENIESSILMRDDLMGTAKEQYEQSIGGKKMREEIDNAAKEDPVIQAMSEGTPIVQQLNGMYKVQHNKYTYSEDGEVKETKESYVLVNSAKFNQSLEKYNELKTNYDNGLVKLIGGDNSHLREKNYVFIGSDESRAGTINSKGYKRYSEGVKTLHKTNSGEIKLINSSELIEGVLEPVEEMTDENTSVDYQNKIMNILSMHSDDIVVVGPVPGTSQHAPGYRVQFKVPEQSKLSKKENDIYGDLAGRSLDLTIEVNPEGSGAAKSIVTDLVANVTKGGEEIAKQANDWYDYGAFTPTAGDKQTYYNDNNLKTFFTPTGFGAKFIEDPAKDKVDLYKENGQYSLKKLDGRGITSNLTYSDLLKDAKFDNITEFREWIKNDGTAGAIVYNIANAIKKEQGYRESINPEAYIYQRFQSYRTSDDPVKTDRYEDILYLL